MKMSGYITRIPEGKQFGFIRNGKDDYFFHREDFNDNWHKLVEDVATHGKVEVEFDGKETPKGLRAENVSLI